MRLTKAKLFTFLTLMLLCMSVFIVPARAASAAPPSVVAWINGDGLFIETRGGQSGVEAVFINDNRVNYRVDGKLELPVVSYAGTGQFISIYAVDFAGSKSNVVQLLNPFYVAPLVTPTPATPTPTAKPTQVTTPQPTTAPTTEPTPEATLEPVITTEPQTAEQTSQLKPFTPGGTGEVMDNVTESDGKEFFTIDTEDGSVFFLVIDRQRTGDNVYLLNAVTEQDLMALAKKNGSTASESTSAIQTPEPTTAPETAPPTATPEPETKPPVTPASNNNNMYIVIALAVIVVGAAGYYFKIVRGKNASNAEDEEYEDEDEDEDEYGYDDETEAEEDYDDSESEE